MSDRLQSIEDTLNKGKKYVKDRNKQWSLKPAYVSHELDKVTGPNKDARREELKAKARAFALRQAAKSKEK